MKCLCYILFALGFALSSCSSPERDHSGEEAVCRAAERDADAVAKAAPGSMEQQGAVIEIRVRENALRDGGFDNEADLYISTVSRILVDSLHILPPRG